MTFDELEAATVRLQELLVVIGYGSPKVSISKESNGKWHLDCTANFAALADKPEECFRKVHDALMASAKAKLKDLRDSAARVAYVINEPTLEDAARLSGEQPT